jgi:hypothetical protein
MFQIFPTKEKRVFFFSGTLFHCKASLRSFPECCSMSRHTSTGHNVLKAFLLKIAAVETNSHKHFSPLQTAGKGNSNSKHIRRPPGVTNAFLSHWLQPSINGAN